MWHDRNKHGKTIGTQIYWTHFSHIDKLDKHYLLNLMFARRLFSHSVPSTSMALCQCTALSKRCPEGA